jgi:hypothetical protein
VAPSRLNCQKYSQECLRLLALKSQLPNRPQKHRPPSTARFKIFVGQTMGNSPSAAAVFTMAVYALAFALYGAEILTF